MIQNGNASITQMNVVQALLLGLWDSLRIFLRMLMDWLLIFKFLFFVSLIICWKVIALPFIILGKLIAWHRRQQAIRNGELPRPEPFGWQKIKRGYQAVMKACRWVINFIGKCFRFLWKSFLFLIYLLTFCSDRLEGFVPAALTSEPDDSPEEGSHSYDAGYEEDEYPDSGEEGDYDDAEPEEYEEINSDDDAGYEEDEYPDSGGEGDYDDAEPEEYEEINSDDDAGYEEDEYPDSGEEGDYEDDNEDSYR